MNINQEIIEALIDQTKSVSCQRHLKEIILINISPDIKIGDRAICEDCQFKGQTIRLADAFQKLQSGESMTLIHLINSIIEEEEQKSQDIIQQLNELKNTIETQIQGIMNRLKSLFKLKNFKFDLLGMLNEYNLNSSKICFIGELISQNTQQNRLKNISSFFQEVIKQDQQMAVKDLEETQSIVSKAISLFHQKSDKQLQKDQLALLEKLNAFQNQSQNQSNHIRFAGFSSDNTVLFLVRQSNIISIVDISSKIEEQKKEICCSEIPQITLFHACQIEHNFVVGDNSKIIIFGRNNQNQYQIKERLLLYDCSKLFLDYHYNSDTISKICVVQKDEINIYLKAREAFTFIWKKRNSFKNLEKSHNLCFNHDGILAFGNKQLQIYFEEKQDQWKEIKIQQTIGNNDLKIVAICQQDIHKNSDKDSQNFNSQDGVKQNSNYRNCLHLKVGTDKCLEQKYLNVIFITFNIGNKQQIFFWKYCEQQFQVTKKFTYNDFPKKITPGQDRILILNNSKILTMIEFDQESLNTKSIDFSQEADLFCMSNKNRNKIVKIHKENYAFMYVFLQYQNYF